MSLFHKFSLFQRQTKIKDLVLRAHHINNLLQKKLIFRQQALLLWKAFLLLLKMFHLIKLLQ